MELVSSQDSKLFSKLLPSFALPPRVKCMRYPERGSYITPFQSQGEEPDMIHGAEGIGPVVLLVRIPRYLLYTTNIFCSRYIE